MVRRTAGVALAAALTGCITEATEVVVLVGSNASPDESVSYRAWVHAGSARTLVNEGGLRWTQRAGRRADEGASFTVVPQAGERRDSVFTLRVEATASGVTVGRTVRAQFALNESRTLRVALNFDCSQAATGCQTLSVPCTLERLCDERGQTCGESARCIAIDQPAVGIDGGLDGAIITLPPRTPFADAATPTFDASPVEDATVDARPDVTAEACAPNCAGRACGANGCGGSCGTCAGGQSCNGSGQCVATCTPNCGGRACGANGCGGSCGNCGAGQACNGSGQCVSTCTPNCAGKRCGSDGCTGSCGNCPSGLTCAAGGTSCACATGCAGGNTCRDNCGYSNTACQSQCSTNYACNLTTGACVCSTRMCGARCCPAGTYACNASGACCYGTSPPAGCPI
jgi:hypothetical protein